MKNVLLSVIVPVYNGSQYIDKLIYIFKKQKMKDFEVIFIDDGSEDDTLEKCLSYQNNLNWLQVIHTENKGVSHARNIGIAAARGTWIHFMDADDKIEVNMYMDFCHASREESSEALVCGCGSWIIYGISGIVQTL